MSDWQAISQLAGGLTLTTFLLFVIWAFVSGKVPTKGELKRVEESEKRAWEQAAEAKEALKANNIVMERMADALGHLRETVEVFTRGRGGGDD